MPGVEGPSCFLSNLLSSCNALEFTACTPGHVVELPCLRRNRPGHLSWCGTHTCAARPCTCVLASRPCTPRSCLTHPFKQASTKNGCQLCAPGMMCLCLALAVSEWVNVCCENIRDLQLLVSDQIPSL